MSKETLESTDKLAEMIEDYKKSGGSVIGLLQDTLGQYGYLSKDTLARISGSLDFPLARLYELATFYKSFRLNPVGKHRIDVCIGTACFVNRAPKILESLERELEIKPGETTEDNTFTLETVNCLGACALGPLVVIDGEYHGKMDQSKLKKLLAKYK